MTDRETAEQLAADGASSEVLAPAAFATYAGWVGVVLVAAHLVLDRMWPNPDWKLSRNGAVATAIAVVFLASLLVIPAVPWAPVKLAALGWVIQRLLRRSAAPPNAPTAIDELAGRIRRRNLLPILLMPFTAALVYGALWPTRDHASHETVFFTMIGLQVIAGAAALVWANWHPSRRRLAPAW